MSWVYVVECADGTFYTGYAEDVADRVKTHNQGNGARYTRSRRPVKLVYAEECPDRSAALRREYQIKQMSRKQKEQLIVGG